MDILQKKYVRCIQQVNIYNFGHMQCNAAHTHTHHSAFLILFCSFLFFSLSHSLTCPWPSLDCCLRWGFILRFNRMSKYDHIYFPCDVRKFNWDAYCYNYTLGLLRYIGQETLEDFDQARRRMRKFRIAHYFVLIIYYSFLASIFYGLGYLFGINAIIRVRIDRILYGLSQNAI